MSGDATQHRPSPLYGLGLRVPHYRDLFEHPAPFDCAEAITENFLDRGGRPRALLERVRAQVPVFLHGVSLGIGGLDPLDREYLGALKRLAGAIEAPYVSDHLAFGSWQGQAAHDLWPLPYTEEALGHVVERVARVQDRLGRRIALENPSTYVAYRCDVMPESEFIAELLERADCWLLLDVNNLYVNAYNHGFDATSYLEMIAPGRVAYLHVAGHEPRGSYLFDDHNRPAQEGVWDLYRRARARFGPVPVIVEWDDPVPPLATVVEECREARRWDEVVAA